MTHMTDDLPALLTGDATREVVLEAAVHLRSCVDCQQELVSAVIAHASLASAKRFASELVEVAELPDLAPMFDEVRAEAEEEATVRAVKRTRRRLVAVAAAAVVVGGGVTAYTLSSGDDTLSGRTVALAGTSTGAVTGSYTGKVTLASDNRMIVDTGLPEPTGGEQYEVWLTGSDDGRQAVGYLNRGGAEITVPGDVMQNYKGIAVSVQRNGQSEFSGKVVLAGRYG